MHIRIAITSAWNTVERLLLVVLSPWLSLGNLCE
jgi:hypothetical protein